MSEHPSVTASKVSKAAKLAAEHAALKCDGWCDNQHTGITHIDESGFAYCTPCGERRQYDGWKRCRKLRRHELNRLLRGEQLARY